MTGRRVRGRQKVGLANDRGSVSNPGPLGVLGVECGTEVPACTAPPLPLACLCSFLMETAFSVFRMHAWRMTSKRECQLIHQPNYPRSECHIGIWRCAAQIAVLWVSSSLLCAALQSQCHCGKREQKRKITLGRM